MARQMNMLHRGKDVIASYLSINKILQKGQQDATKHMKIFWVEWFGTRQCLKLPYSLKIFFQIQAY
jgi:hypothetical protein